MNKLPKCQCKVAGTICHKTILVAKLYQYHYRTMTTTEQLVILKNARITRKAGIEKISAIADESVAIDPIEAAQKQMIRVHQVVTNCCKMTCKQSKTDTWYTTVVHLTTVHQCSSKGTEWQKSVSIFSSTILKSVEEYPAERRPSTPMLVFQYPSYSGPLANIVLDRKTLSIEQFFSRNLHHRYSSTSRFFWYPNFVARWRHFAGIWPQSWKFDPDFLGPYGAQGGLADIVR